jgi:cell division protein FtsI (penicillin-binding protein 3)/stage V sporulation protein D (sporulation-specific penicillin-binding protein)
VGHDARHDRKTGSVGRRGSAPRRPARRAGRTTRDAVRRTLDGRVRLLRIVFVIAFLAIGGKAIALASADGHLAAMARDQQVRTIALPSQRGVIVDRDGTQLAVAVAAKTVYATPYMLDNAKAAARRLAAALKLKWGRVYRAIDDPRSGFTYVDRQADPALADKATALGLPGVASYVEEKRVYPLNTVAAQVVGYAGIDGHGLAGVEYEYDKELAGTPGRQVVVQDPAGQALHVIQSVSPKPGQDVRLTIDSGIQIVADNVLAETVRRFHAKGGTAIVENPRTGEIYAMSNVPLVNANRFGESPAHQGNKAVIYSYEPGSTFKMVTIAAALSDGLVTPETSFVLPPALRVGDRVIHDAELRGTERMNVSQILAKSSNIGAVTIGWKLLGKQRLLDWIYRFGFGKLTGIDFPGEVPGFVLPGDQWWSSTIGNVPMGQGISVTPIQMVAAYGAVANGGVMMKPHLTAQIGDRVIRPAAGRRIVSAAVARQLRGMLSDVVADGTGTEARIPGYVVAGKTGTAQKALPNGGGYSKVNYVASFIGMVPARDPQLVVAVVVDEPHPYWGGTVAAPAFRQIAGYALQRLEIAP